MSTQTDMQAVAAAFRENDRFVVTFHDSCNVARGSRMGGMPGGQFEIPRAIVRAQQLKHETGVLVISLEPNSPAERAELREGDVIVALDDNPVRSVDDLHRLLTDARIGSRCQVDLLRQSQKRTLTVLAQEAPT